MLLLGKLADMGGVAEMRVPAPLDWPGLIAALPAPLAQAAQGTKVRLAVNGVLLADKTTLAALTGDEIALLPPVSGG